MQLAHILWLHGFDACVTVSRVQMLQSSVLMTLFAFFFSMPSESYYRK